MKLTVQLTPEQVDAANRIHARLPDSRLIDGSLKLLGRNAAAFSPEAHASEGCSGEQPLWE
jgi:hypothetical protein